MKGTSILNFRPFAKINPPLPRTPRESQQLLNALTSSFRRQLDHEYPTHSSSDRGGNNATSEYPRSSAQATDKHLKAILDNPLFRVVPSKTIVDRDQSGLGNIEQQRLATEPMVVFDELVASGSVSMAVVLSCLKSQLLLASTHTGNGFIKAMKDSRAGSKVVVWWRASDSESRKMLLKSRASTSSLLKFMVAEGLQDTVKGWLRMLLTLDIGGNDGRISESFAQQTFGNLLIDFLAAETQYGGGLNRAMQYYLEACKMQLSVGDQLSSQYRKPMLLPAGAHLCNLIMQNEQAHAKEVPASIYEEFIKVISTLSPRSLLLATVPVYHPTHPDPGPFLKFVDALPRGRFGSWTEAKRESFLRAGFDALRILVDQEKFGDASYLARFIQQSLPDKDSQKLTSKTSQHTSAEEENLLSRLGLVWT